MKRFPSSYNAKNPPFRSQQVSRLPVASSWNAAPTFSSNHHQNFTENHFQNQTYSVGGNDYYPGQVLSNHVNEWDVSASDQYTNVPGCVQGVANYGTYTTSMFAFN